MMLAYDRAAPRPLQRLSMEDLIHHAEKAASCKPADVDSLLLCWSELDQRPRRNQAARGRLETVMSDIRLGGMEPEQQHRVGDGPWGLQPIPWFTQAREAARQVGTEIRRERGHHHHLYVVLIGGFGERGNEFGLYVGETRRRPDVRLTQHLNGRYASKVVKRNGICLLPSLYEHLNPLSRKAAKELEPALAEAFVNAGLPKRRVKGGH